MTTFFLHSMDKIVNTYFAGICSAPFEFNGKTFEPKDIHVSPHMFRGTTCPIGCGGCCQRFSLVWLPDDPQPEDYPHSSPHVVTINGIARQVIIDMQDDHDGYRCRHLQPTTGRCGIHTTHPFSCDFELIRFVQQADRTLIGVRPFGRGWSYTRIDGQKGAICDVLPVSLKHRDDNVRKLTWLKKFTDYWQLPTHLPEIIDWVKSGPHETPLVIRSGRRTLFDHARTKSSQSEAESERSSGERGQEQGDVPLPGAELQDPGEV